MREIKKVEMSQAPSFDSKPTEKTEPQFCGENPEQKVVKDLSSQYEVSGRSQINKTDNLKADVAFGLANPGVISNADKFFEMAYAHLMDKNDPDAYEKAATMATIYAKELC